MSFEALKDSPIPALYHLGYRIVRSRSNKKKEIVVYFAKPENAIEYLDDPKVHNLCLKRLEELKDDTQRIKRKVHKYKKSSCLDKILDFLKRIFKCFLK